MTLFFLTPVKLVVLAFGILFHVLREIVSAFCSGMLECKQNFSSWANVKLCFRKQVALNQWLHQNMEAVVSMYEDRFDLRTLQSQLIEGPSKTNTDNFSWWKRLTLRKSESVASPLHYVVINDISITVKRTKELRALTGWYVLSLCYFVFYLHA